jgi:hypothetical protein
MARPQTAIRIQASSAPKPRVLSLVFLGTPPTGSHLRSRVSSVNFTSTLSKRLMRRSSISLSKNRFRTLPRSPSGQNRGNYLVAINQGQEGDGARGNETIIDGDYKRDQQFWRDAEAIPIS